MSLNIKNVLLYNTLEADHVACGVLFHIKNSQTEREIVEITYTKFVDKSRKRKKKYFVLSSRKGGFCHFENLKMSVENCN